MSKMEDILRVASKMFYKHGYDNTSMRDLAKATDLTTAGLYYYIKSKQNLLHEVEGFHYKQLEKKIFLSENREKDPEKRIKQFIRNVVNQILNHPESYSILRGKAIFRGEFANAFKARRRELLEKTEEFFVRLKKEGFAAKDIDKSVDITVGSFSLIGIINWIPLWYNPKGRITKEQLIDSISKFYIKWFFKGKRA